MSWLSLLATVAASQTPALHWEGTAEVYPLGRTLKIAVRSHIDRNGNVVSESWPIELGESRGLRRILISAQGGTMERAGEKQAMPTEIWSEERAQFGFYRQLQEAHSLAFDRARSGVTTFSVPGEVTTWFRVATDGSLVGAINEVPVGGPGQKAYQTFRFAGFWLDDGAIFPKHLEMTRDGKPFFTLDVTKFDAR